MERKSWVSVCFFCLLLVQLFDSQAQKIERTITLKWVENLTYTISEDETLEFVHFNQAVYPSDFPTLPCYYERIPVDYFYDDYEISISDIHYESFDAHSNSLIDKNFHQKVLDVQATSAYEKTQPYLLLSFVPIVEQSSGQYARVNSVTITLSGRNVAQAKSRKSHPEQSVLKSGQWYSFELAQTGIYKVAYSDLVALGMSTPIISHNIAVFGNGGAMLPEANSKSRIEDLRELPISIFDGGDGKIEEGDYFLFYGESPHSWKYDTVSGHFSHSTNIYSDVSHYFITNTPGIGEKKRVQMVDHSSLTANMSVNEYTYYDFLEEDAFNFNETGKEWFGDLFDITTTRTYNVNIPNYVQGVGRIMVAGACASSSSSYFTLKANGNNLGTLVFPAISGGESATLASKAFPFTPTASSLTISLDYSKPGTSSAAYLDWIEVEVPCRLTMFSEQFPFCTPATVGNGNIAQFNIGNANANMQVWDVTDPGQTFQYVLSAEGSTYSFKTPTDVLRKFVAFNGARFLNITPKGMVANQNLHATNNVDLVIITHPDFQSEANRLADFRRANDGLNVKVVTIQQVYNEFSSGSQDPMAIRDYMKMIYDKTDKQYPKYLLLVGRPSYDYRGRVKGTEIFVPNYQYTANGNSLNELYSYSNDDTFGLLDDSEGDNGKGLYDIAIGRFPCSTVAQARAAVDKSINYTKKGRIVSDNASQISNFGDWRNIMAFVADDEDGSYYMENADSFSSIIESTNDNINLDKIYLDAFQQVSNAGGQRYPDVNTAITNRMNRGALFFTYVGHSGKDGWANERILENSDINKWNNKYNLPVMLTLSCTFGRYDRPSISPAELALFNSNGGVSAIVTADREAWSTSNASFGIKFFNHIFNTERGRYPTVGEVAITGKNLTGASANLNMFVLMGDPSMPFAIPTYHIVTDSINHQPAGSALDTVRAFSKLTVCGHVEDENGHVVAMNGSLFPSIYDKKITTSTLSNDPGSPKMDFTIQKSILFKGNCSVTDGKFNFSCYIPKDIDYTYGNGKISYYACSDYQDAAGAFSNFIIGGTDTNGLNDKEGPSIELFLNDENFVNGGIVGNSPMLIAKVKDNYGINTTGNGIGHDLTAVLDDATESQIVLNDYYQTEKDSFNVGTIRYNLSDLPVGKHKIMVRAWDINNNHSESELSFEVVSDEKLTLSHVLNYPNPFTTHTDFYFEHNQNGGLFDILIQIYTISGKLVKTISTSQFMDGNRSGAIPWDGRDDYGDKIGKGVYMYRLKVRNQNNETADVFEKLVIL